MLGLFWKYLSKSGGRNIGELMSTNLITLTRKFCWAELGLNLTLLGFGNPLSTSMLRRHWAHEERAVAGRWLLQKEGARQPHRLGRES